MSGVLVWIKRAWRRNFGHVYLWSGIEGDPWYRFRARRGRVALVWNTLIGPVSFRCRLLGDGTVANDHDRCMSGYGMQYGRWVWDYEPHGMCAGKGGAW